MEGPVVKASKTDLETGNINYVLIWVSEVDEQEIKDLFNRVLEVRKLNDTAKELADNYFFETVVRVHRMGEGVAYTGLKNAGYKPEEGIKLSDAAIEKNSVNDILTHLNESEQSNVKELFDDVISKKNFNINDINAGRVYVASYVHFIHYVEELFSNNKESHTHKH
jgi:hypothetical protein